MSEHRDAGSSTIGCMAQDGHRRGRRERTISMGRDVLVTRSMGLWSSFDDFCGLAAQRGCVACSTALR